MLLEGRADDRLEAPIHTDATGKPIGVILPLEEFALSLVKLLTRLTDALAYAA